MQDLNDLNLVALDALLRERSPTRAARLLGLSQPAMSHALARLRDQLGDPLLVRAGRGFVLTARAEALAPELHAALDRLKTALSVARDFDPNCSTRSFRVGTADYGELVLIPQVHADLARSAPGVDLWVVRQAPSLESLGESDTDLLISLIQPDDPMVGCRARALFRERFVVVMRQGHPLLDEPLTVERFAAARHAFIAPRGGPGGVVDSALARLGLSRRIALAVPHFLVAPYAVASSDLVLTVAERVARTYAAILPLAIVQPPLPLPDFTMHLIWHERHHHDAGHRWLRERITHVAAGLPS